MGSLWERFLKYFYGMFSFAIYDYRNIYLANDIFGEKPLYYLKNKSGIFFSSEPKNIIKFEKVEFNPSRNNILDFLSLGFTPSSTIGFEDIICVPPASLIKINSPKEIEIKKYWRIEEISQKDKKKSIDKRDILQLKNNLIDSIESRLVSDVGKGIFLSSGIDSTLIATLITKELNQKLDSFTLSFSDGFDESSSAKKVANFLNIKNYTINYLNDEYNKDINNSLYKIYNELNDNRTAISIRQLSKFANNYIKVAIGGVGRRAFLWV